MALKLLASSAGKWGPDGCSANPMMEAHYGEAVAQSEKQREGDAAHHVFADTFRSGTAPAVGTLAPNNTVITQEMVECSQDIVRDITDTLTKGAVSQDALFYVEYSFNPKLNIHPENVGRCDAVIIDAARFRVYIWEYKYGHRYVAEYRNWQIINAAIGVMENLGIPQSSWPQWQFVGTVSQPRNYHPDGPLREWHFTGEQLVGFAVDLKASAISAQVERPIATTGEHCRDCAGRHACGILQSVAMGLVDLSLEAAPQEMTPAALGLFLVTVRDAMKRLGALAEGLEEQAMFKVRSGVDVPHWKGDYSQGREKWNVPPEQVTALGQNYNVDLSKPPQTLTPAQARKAGVPDDMVQIFAERPRGAMTLVRFSESDAARRFQQ